MSDVRSILQTVWYASLPQNKSRARTLMHTMLPSSTFTSQQFSGSNVSSYYVVNKVSVI